MDRHRGTIREKQPGDCAPARSGALIARGFSLIEIIVTVGIVSILVLLAFPRLQRYRMSAFDSNAEAFAKGVAIAQGTYKASHDKYATSMDELVKVDRNLLDTPNVTFEWIEISESAYTLNARHKAGSRWYTAHDD